MLLGAFITSISSFTERASRRYAAFKQLTRLHSLEGEKSKCASVGRSEPTVALSIGNGIFQLAVQGKHSTSFALLHRISATALSNSTKLQTSCSCNAVNITEPMGRNVANIPPTAEDAVIESLKLALLQDLHLSA